MGYIRTVPKIIVSVQNQDADVVLLMIEMLHDFRDQNSRGCGSII